MTQVERTDIVDGFPANHGGDAPAYDSPSEISVGDDIVTTGTRWSFGGATHERFDTHVQRSVPLYEEGHRLISQTVEFFARPGKSIIDVGCSTGSILERLAQKPSSTDVTLCGYDIEADMVRSARSRCANFDNVMIRQGDAESIDYTGSGAVIMYYTLQFTEPKCRLPILTRIANSLSEGGALLLFEKVLGPDAATQEIIGQLYQEFKVLNGFGADEIYNKARSLRSVMNPVSSERNCHDLLNAGFRSVVTLQKYLCFEGFLAIK